jgi:hypothetical protein
VYICPYLKKYALKNNWWLYIHPTSECSYKNKKVLTTTKYIYIHKNCCPCKSFEQWKCKKEWMNEWSLENNMSSTLTSILLIERFGNFRSNFLSTLTSLLHMEDSVILGQMFPLLNLPLILGRHKICMIEVESHFLSSWASEWTSLFDYMFVSLDETLSRLGPWGKGSTPICCFASNQSLD